MKPSPTLFAQLRKPSIHFIGKRSLPSTRHAAQPHPYAPPEFQRVFTPAPQGSSASTSSSPSSSSPSSGSDSDVPVYTHFWEAPSKYWKSRVNTLEDREMDAIMSGGASSTW
ncbi:hypothetical protein CC1G_11379 [Coprinopsis cinerea okayama7|uniref:Uncharacterized protein n=1 Tax=Coprinopsis cinerea (strain Okayama-7 / 130 / ATCC MYA-4618 / FGSC 9003) TaxID=240176 RepID=A8PGG9_COPC7|nr:hypothetical protein CC1G_11379 [Coprinopsis cinerea okayama7\|eukprot:XP_001841216.1 hypothetical protein CC1G_11379 [Coprinopsis cinerea okayama7\